MFGLGILFNLSVSAGTQVLVTGIILRKKSNFIMFMMMKL